MAHKKQVIYRRRFLWLTFKETLKYSDMPKIDKSMLLTVIIAVIVVTVITKMFTITVTKDAQVVYLLSESTI